MFYCIVASRNRDTDIENKHEYQGGKGGDMSWEVETDTYTLLTLNKIDN